MLLLIKIVAGVLLPAGAAITFNVLQLVVDSHETGTAAAVGASAYDVAVGCAFALFGLGIAARDALIGRAVVTISVVLIVVILLVEIAGPLAFDFVRFEGIMAMNVVSMAALAFGVWITD